MLACQGELADDDIWEKADGLVMITSFDTFKCRLVNQWVDVGEARYECRGTLGKRSTRLQKVEWI